MESSPGPRGTSTSSPSLLFIADGASPIVQRWLSHAADRGYRVGLLTLAPPPHPIPGVWSIPVPRTPARVGAVGRYLAAIPALLRSIRQQQPDIVHAHYGGGYGLLGALCHGRSQFVLSLWGSDLLVSPRRSRLRAALLRWMTRRADAICVNSAYLKEQATAYTNKRVHVTYFGVDPLFFAQHGGERPADTPLRLATVKTFNENSGIDILLQAVRVCLDNAVPVHLTAVGHDPRGSAQSLATSLGVADVVTFTGPLLPSEVARVFAAADVYVQPTVHTEGFGVAVAEAQAASVPAIVSRVGGLVEAVDPISGEVVPPGDPQALAEALTRFSVDPAKLVRSREDARRHGEHFHWDLVAPAMDRVYGMLASGFVGDAQDRSDPIDGKEKGVGGETPGFIPFALPDIGDREVDAVVGAMRSGWLTTGPNAAAFEAEFVADLQRQARPDQSFPEAQAVAVNSATAGLHLALEAVGIGPGDEVVVPTWTFTATAEVVRYLGATPVIVDVDPVTLNLDLAAAEAALTSRTRAIMPVHFAGLPVDRHALAAFATAHDLRVIEDAAHAHPVLSDGIPVGLGQSEAVVFSFYATKTMTTGEGGMVVSRHPEILDRMRTMRLHGISRDVFDRYTSTAPSWHYEVVAPGFKDNMTDLAAALGRVQLTRSAAMRGRRAAIAAQYDAAFADLAVRLPARPVTSATTHAWHLYVLRLKPQAPVERNRFIELMAQAGVGCSVHFIPLHHHPYWRELRGAHAPALPVADAQFGRAVSLPIFSSMTQEQIDKVIASVRSILG